MALSDPRAGLRRPGVRLMNRTHSVAKVSLLVPSGSELEVDDEVAAQLLHTGQFAAVAEEAAPVVVAQAVEEAGGGSARRASGRRKAD